MQSHFKAVFYFFQNSFNILLFLVLAPRVVVKIVIKSCKCLS